MAFVSITIPYDVTLSKNVAYRYGGTKAVKKDGATTANQNAIAMRLQLKAKPRGVPTIVFRKDRLAVHIHVVRPIDPRVDGPRKDVDPANFQPFIIDAVEQGIGIDDSFFETQVTWSVAAPDQEPCIVIAVTQDDSVLQKNEDKFKIWGKDGEK